MQLVRWSKELFTTNKNTFNKIHLIQLKMNPRIIIISILLFAIIAPIFGQIFYPKYKTNKKYHLMILKTVNWFTAYSHCRSLDMSLVSITSKEENNRIIQQIEDEGRENSDFWTSGTKLSDNVTCEWMSTGKRFTFTNWIPGEPSDYEMEHCIHIVGKNTIMMYQMGIQNLHKWNDAPCSIEKHFICEQQLIEYEYCTN
ncbi:C-type lectin 37Da-like [Contarinia nasturtii]|uniref:C-type lectin 37Da-like n=1 Tax=Contarinia nasturtii TaxID=265458 RepID=UPI0012D488BF|nr:C-type lectin 37Da-like [Contarinia nasturtii]